MTVTALLSFAGGATASVWASFEAPEGQELVVTERAGIQRLAKPFSSWRDPDDPYQLMVESFGDSVIENRAVAISPEDSIANMTAIDRIRAAARAI